MLVGPPDPAGDAKGDQRSAGDTGNDDRFRRRLFDPKEQREWDGGPNQQEEPSAPLADGSHNQEIGSVHQGNPMSRSQLKVFWDDGQPRPGLPVLPDAAARR